MFTSTQTVRTLATIATEPTLSSRTSADTVAPTAPPPRRLPLSANCHVTSASATICFRFHATTSRRRTTHFGSDWRHHRRHFGSHNPTRHAPTYFRCCYRNSWWACAADNFRFRFRSWALACYRTTFRPLFLPRLTPESPHWSLNPVLPSTIDPDNGQQVLEGRWWLIQRNNDVLMKTAISQSTSG